MVEEHREVERKFDVPDAFTLPGLTGLGGVAAVGPSQERRLEAVYHDTADLRLARARVTLRRRTGGPDAGWHVKLPASGDSRRELRFPLGRAGRTPPRAVLAPVRGLVRGAAVGPVATVQTRRVATELRDAEGRVLAEVADDLVTATVPAADPVDPAEVSTWRELEVELVDGDATLLDAVMWRLLDAGAAPSPSASKLGRVLAGRLAATPDPVGAAAAALDAGPEDAGAPGKGRRKGKREPAGPTAATAVLAAVAGQVRALQAADLLVRTDDPEGVHDVRVACRRLRSLLAAGRPVLDRERTDPVRAELRRLGRELSAARDGQVALAHLRALVAEQPPELVLGAVTARLRQAEADDAAAGRRAAARVLGSDRYLALLDELAGLVADPPLTADAQRPAARVLAGAVRRSGKRLRRAVEAAREHPPGGVAAGDALHEVRKAAKRVRYTAEMAEPVLGAPAAALVACAKEVQEVLGARQDTVVTRERCRVLGIAAGAAGGESAWTWGRLHGLEEGRAHDAERRFWELEPALHDAVARARAAG